MKNSFRKAAALLACFIIIFSFSAVPSFAASPTDEILNYIIVADVNDDGTVNLGYHIDWKVLVSDGIGPLEDVYVGIPNSKYITITPLSDNISSMGYESNYGDSTVHLYFNDKYYAGETVSFEFMVVQDYMYEMNALEDGYTLYYFVPGWFDEIAVDNLVIFWKSDNLETFSPGGYIQDGYNVWQTSLKPGERFELKLTYPNDAYMFDESKSYNYPNGNGGGGDYPGFSFGDLIFGLLGLFLFFILPIMLVARVIKKVYNRTSGFAAGDTKTKVTRTKIEYYPNCPGCGAQRKEGQTVCEYCGRSLVKSEEIIKEEEVKDEDKGALKYKKNGEYRYGSDPNTYVRVNVIHVPVSSSSSRSSSSRSSSSSSRSGRSGGGSSCAHSSCACACASCACACACACAGGGRAGCSTKDFYNTKLKLKQLEMKAKKK
ncbi:MAG: hypothetical protein IJI56_01690 [Firmicutes bacterium]|nr:hypothetical protein [Bacillota bacterium]